MSLTSAKGRFQAYLLSPIEHYPVSKMPLSLKPTQDRRKELIFQQKLFLQVAEEYQSTRPWLTYFATMKHFRVINANQVNTASFNDLRDKEFATEVAATAEKLRDSAAAILDTDGIKNLDYLCQLQEVAPLAAKAKSTLAEIAGSKHYQAVVKAAKGEKPANGCLVLIGGSILGAFLMSAASESRGAGVAFAVVSLSTGLVAALQFFRWQTITALLARFRSDVIPVAEILACSPIDWSERPAEAQSFLDAANANREELEHTYLILT